MPSPVGGPSGIPGPPVKSDEESVWIFRAGKAVWASLTSLVISGLTASRLVRTNASGQLESNAALTNTRIMYADANGWPTDSANFTFSTTVCTIANTTAASSATVGAFVVGNGTSATSVATGNGTVYVGDLLRVLGGGGTNTVIEAGSNSKASSTYINMNAAAGQTRAFTFQSGGSFRWLVSCSNTAESGSDAGSNFAINAYTDAGGFIDTPLTIARVAGGTMTLVRPMTLSTASSGLTISKTTGTTLTVSSTDAVAVNVAGGIKSIGATQGIGYATGAGGAVTQITSRTTGVTLNTICGEITLVSAAGSATWQSFTVTNSAMAATDEVIPNQKSGTDLYLIHITAKAAGSFRVSFATTGGTTTEQPVFGFSIIKGVAA